MNKGYFLRVKHPSALNGTTGIIFRGKEIHFELIDGEAEITEEMGGIDLVNHLVFEENYKDTSRYAPGQATAPVAQDNTYGWDLQSPNARDDKKEDGYIGITLNDGSTRQLAMIQNIIFTENKEIRDILVKQEGFSVRRGYEKGDRPERRVFNNTLRNEPARVVPDRPRNFSVIEEISQAIELRHAIEGDNSEPTSPQSIAPEPAGIRRIS